ncbi:MAG: 2-C-methyl-D-erythritol 4-phosphate cytidylyltransferase [Gemmatimonadaceae bacterium]
MSAAAPDVGVVIVAAGGGTRAGGGDRGELKQFRWVAGKPMLLHSIHRFQERADVALVVCVLPRRYAGDPPPWIFQCDTDRLLVSVGGKERGDSVMNGLEDLPPDLGIVLVHDAARPLVDAATIERVIAVARTGVGAVAGLPIADTLKAVDQSGRISATVDRGPLWRAQTPQGFPRDMLVRAYVEARAQEARVTDDAALCERLGFPVMMVRGTESALKITEESDFARADALAGSWP